MKLDDLDAELLEIDENLRRYDLTAWEQSQHIERREALLKKKGQRAKASPGTNQHEVPLTVSGTKTTAELANEAGMSTATYKRRSAVGREIADETAEILNSITDLKAGDLPDSPKRDETEERAGKAREQAAKQIAAERPLQTRLA